VPPLEIVHYLNDLTCSINNIIIIIIIYKIVIIIIMIKMVMIIIIIVISDGIYVTKYNIKSF